MKKTIYLLIFINYSLLGQSLIQSGPMLGYSEMREVLIWIQTNQKAKVKAAYWEINNSNNKKFTEEITTQKETAFTAKLIADKVQPSQKYEYEIYINDKIQKFTYPLSFHSKTQWLWRTDAPDFKFALGSCAYVNEWQYDRPGEPYGGNYEIYKSIYSKKPDAMIWLGDNTYLREADWDTKTGIQHRYTHTRSLPELQPLLASTHHFAIWDDHDFGPNDSDRSFYNKNQTLETFKLFWGNKNFGINENKGITSSFQWADCEFFLLDDRFFKSPNNRKNTPCTILGEEQKQWLIDALTSSKSTFKFIAVGSQFINDAPGAKENFVNCPEERNFILNAIKDEKISGVIFLTGDRHHSEISKLERDGSYPIYDITVSPLGAGVHKKAKDESNSLRIPASLIMERNFAIIEVTGSKAERQLKISYFDISGIEKYNYIIKAKDLK